MPAIKKAPRKKKFDTIGESIRKAKLEHEKRFEVFKKPFPVSEKENEKSNYIDRSKNVKMNHEVISLSLRPLNSPIKERRQTTPTEVPIHILKYFSMPKILSPIKNTRKPQQRQKAVKDPTSEKLGMPIFDNEMQRLMDIFAKNIENLANGNGKYEQMIFPEQEDYQDNIIGEKRRSNYKESTNKRRKLKIN